MGMVMDRTRPAVVLPSAGMSIDQWKSRLVTTGGCNDELKPIDRGMDHFLYVDDQQREPRVVAGGPAGCQRRIWTGRRRRTHLKRLAVQPLALGADPGDPIIINANRSTRQVRQSAGIR